MEIIYGVILNIIPIFNLLLAIMGFILDKPYKVSSKNKDLYYKDYKKSSNLLYNFYKL